jgi:hypothetical protein
MKRRTRGQIIVLFVISLVVLIGLAALGIDVGYWYTVRHELQRCADAGALAGASYFKETGYWSDSPGDPQMAIAEARARTVASQDNVVTSPLDYNSEIFVSFPEHYRIRVGTERTISLFFAKLFLGPTTTIRAYAVAEAFPVTQNVACLVPWGIPAPWNDANNNGIYDEGDSFDYPNPNDNDAVNAYKGSHCDPINGNTVWDPVYHVISGTRSNRDDWLCNGSLQTLKLTPGANDDNTATQRVPGNFYGMDYFNLVNSCPGMDPTHGADFYSYMIKHSCDCEFKVSQDDILDTAGDPLTSLPGNMVKPTVSPVAPDKYYAPPIGEYYINVDGVQTALPSDWRDVESLMNGDPTASWANDLSGNTGGHPQSDVYVWHENGEYSESEKPWWLSPRVITVPIYSPDPNYAGSNGEYTPEKGGKTSFKPIGFVGFWIQDIQYFPPNNGSIIGRFVTVPGGGSSTEPGPAGTQVLNIRLVE